MKKCSNCLIEKSYSEFNTDNKKYGDGFQGYCRSCTRAYYKAYNTRRKAEKQTVWVDSKTCRDCGLKKPISQFGVKNNNPDKHNIYCKPCNRERTYASIRKNKHAKSVR